MSSGGSGSGNGKRPSKRSGRVPKDEKPILMNENRPDHSSENNNSKSLSELKNNGRSSSSTNRAANVGNRENTGAKVEDESDRFEVPGPSNGSLAEYSIPLSSLNPFLTCPLCEGYLIEPITVMDCLHTFCKSCILMYFEDHNDCPKCHFLIHQSHPSHYVCVDRTLQEIVYKLVPGLQEEERRRKEEFLEERRRLGLPTNTADCTEDEEEEPRTKRARRSVTKRALGQRNGTVGTGSGCGNGAGTQVRNGVYASIGDGTLKLNNEPIDSPTADLNGDITPVLCCENMDIHQAHNRHHEALLVNLIPADDSESIDRPYIRLSLFATINTLKRTLALCLQEGDMSHYNDYDIFCNGELMGRDFSMLFIQKTRWRDHPPEEPLLLAYKLHREF